MVRADMFTKWTSASGQEGKRERERKERFQSINGRKELRDQPQVRKIEG